MDCQVVGEEIRIYLNLISVNLIVASTKVESGEVIEARSRV